MPKFRLLRGTHHQAKWVGEGKAEENVGRTFVAGEIIETDENLLKYNGGTTDTVKFELVQEEANDLESLKKRRDELDKRIAEAQRDAVSQAAKDGANPSKSNNLNANRVADNFDDMTVAELRKIAEEEEVDITGVTRKEQIIERLRAAVV